MPDKDPDRIDPRYDAAFQRGYAGEVRTAPRAESALRRTTAVTPAPARQSAPAAPPVAEAPPVLAVPVEHPAPEAPSAEPARVGVEERAADAATVRGVSRNPFYLAAAALAVLLIVGGAVWLDQGFAAIQDDLTTTSVGYYAAMVMGFGAPLAIGIGVAIIGGLLFVLARTWRPRDDERR
jgi:hypothetical protein